MRDALRACVTTVFEDTVIAVDTLGGRRRTAWPLIVAGGLGLVLAALALVEGGSASVGWSERLRWEALLVTGFVGGLAMTFLGLLRRDRRNDELRVDGCPMVTRQGDRWIFCRPEGMTGVPDAHVLERGVRLRGTLGRRTYIVSLEEPARPRLGAGMGSLDERMLGSTGISVLLHAVLLLILLMVPAAKRGLASEIDIDELRRVKIIMHAPEAPRREPGTGERAALPGESGPAGKPVANAVPGKLSLQKRAEGEPRVAPPSPARGRTAGILAYFHTHPDAFAAVTATADVTTGLDDRDVLAWNGPGGGDAPGWGAGPRGVGPGGSGTDPRSVGVDRYRTGPGGPGTWYPPGRGPTLAPRRPHPTLHIGQVVAGADGLDPNLIRRYLRRRADEIAYCYEKELTVRPTLAGTSTARFAIDQGGRVLRAVVDGFDPVVDGCIAAVLRRIEFPRSQGVYTISYPFTFRPTGQ